MIRTSRRTTDLPEDVAGWLERHKADADDRLRGAASRAVQRVMCDSELRELWEESADFEGWQARVRDLQSRLVADG